MIKMVSLDTSSTVTGYAVFENGKLKKSGVIDETKEKDTLIRKEYMILSINDLLTKENPDIVVIELTVVQKNANTQRLLSDILGTVWGWCLCNAAEYVEYRPTTWRKLVAGEDEKVPIKRDDAKIWSLDKCRELFHGVDTDDESDAILIGYARIRQFGVEH